MPENCAASRAEMYPTQTKVAIVGGDPVVGEALEALLQAAGYSTRFLPEPVMDDPTEMLAGSQLILLAPTLSAERGEAFLEMMLSPATSVNVPVLELLPANGGRRLRARHTVLWPCSREELKQAIDALVFDQGRSDPA